MFENHSLSRAHSYLRHSIVNFARQERAQCSGFQTCSIHCLKKQKNRSLSCPSLTKDWTRAVSLVPGHHEKAAHCSWLPVRKGSSGWVKSRGQFPPATSSACICVCVCVCVSCACTDYETMGPWAWTCKKAPCVDAQCTGVLCVVRE